MGGQGHLTEEEIKQIHMEEYEILYTTEDR